MISKLSQSFVGDFWLVRLTHIIELVLAILTIALLVASHTVSIARTVLFGTQVLCAVAGTTRI